MFGRSANRERSVPATIQPETGNGLLQGLVVDDESQLGERRAAWDALAERTGHPFCAPAWMLAWWRHVAPTGALLRILVVSDDGDDVVGVAPFFVQRGAVGLSRYRVLGAAKSFRVAPLAAPGRESDVARVFRSLLDRARPRPDLVELEGVAADPPWADLLASPGAGGTWSYRDVARPAPVLLLGGATFDEWLASKSRNFRQQMGRARRRLEGEGATFRSIGPGDDLAE